MVSEIESVALTLFEQRGFADVTVEEIANAAGISPRTFYRHFATKEDVFQVRIDRRAQALREALTERNADEVLFHALRAALVKVVSEEDDTQRRRWMLLVQSSPSLVRATVGGIYLKVNTVMAEFLGTRLGLSADALVPSMLAAAVGGVLIATNAQWLFEGGSLEERITESLSVLERFFDAGV